MVGLRRGGTLGQQHTLASEVSLSGIGLHTGVTVNLRLCPAPAHTGVVFKRTDLDGFTIEAQSRHVARVSYATSLMKKGVLISTTEHLLSALAGLGVDNAIVEIDNLELPIVDGSALPFVKLIRQAGLRAAAGPPNLRQDSKAIGVGGRTQENCGLPLRHFCGQLFDFLPPPRDRRAIAGFHPQRRFL